MTFGVIFLNIRNEIVRVSIPCDLSAILHWFYAIKSRDIRENVSFTKSFILPPIREYVKFCPKTLSLHQKLNIYLFAINREVVWTIPFKPNEIPHFYQLDQSISVLRVVR